MQVVSRDVIWLLSHIHVISSELRDSARARANAGCSCRRVYALQLAEPFVTVTVRTPRCRGTIAGRGALRGCAAFSFTNSFTTCVADVGPRHASHFRPRQEAPLRGNTKRLRRLTRVAITAVVLMMAVTADLILSPDPTASAVDAKAIRVTSSNLITDPGTGKPTVVLSLCEDSL